MSWSKWVNDAVDKGEGYVPRDKSSEASAKQLNLTLDEVSNRVGFSKPYLSTIETGKVKNPPSDELLTRLEKVLKFETGLLLHIAHLERMPSDVRGVYESREAENQKLRQFVASVAEKRGQEQRRPGRCWPRRGWRRRTANPPMSAGRLVPIINKVAAGYPMDFNDLDYPVGIADDYVRCPDLHDPNAFAVRVVGDSMEPRFHRGRYRDLLAVAGRPQRRRLLRPVHACRTRRRSSGCSSSGRTRSACSRETSGTRRPRGGQPHRRHLSRRHPLRAAVARRCCGVVRPCTCQAAIGFAPTRCGVFVHQGGSVVSVATRKGRQGQDRSVSREGGFPRTTCVSRSSAVWTNSVPSWGLPGACSRTKR